MNFLSALALVPGFVSAIQAEMADHPPEARKAVVIALIHAAAGVGEQIPNPYVQVLSRVIDACVKAFWEHAVFKEAAPAPPVLAAKPAMVDLTTVVDKSFLRP